MMTSKVEVKTSKSKIFCCVYGCNSKACKNPDLSFHHFPAPKQVDVQHVNKFGQTEMIDRRKLWEIVLKMGKKVTKSMRVCSVHFVEDDYMVTLPGYPAKKKFLKNISVPSVNLPSSSVQTNKLSEVAVSDRQVRLENRLQQLELVQNKSKKTGNECICSENDTVEDGSNSYEQNNSFHDEDILQENFNNVCKEALYRTIGVQVKSGDLSGAQFFDFFKSDKELSTATGIQNLELFNSIVAAVKIAAPQLNKHIGVLSVRDRVLMTFMKLKQNLSYSFLAIMFPSVTVRYCPDIICNMLDILSDILKPCIHFPSSDEILRNMPVCFKNYTNTQIILDCTEIEIQRPKNLCCQITTYSHYKGRYTIKFMTGVTPGGILSFISRPYGGKASDKAIFEQSLLVEKLEKGVSIMVDRGFLIDDLCFDYDIKLIRPPFLKNQVQFSADDALNNADIASARVHVERLNQRLKVFEIFGNKMSSCLVPKSEQIMIILSAIVNLSNPIFKDDKFIVIDN